MARPLTRDSVLRQRPIRNREGSAHDATSRDNSTKVSALPVYAFPTICGRERRVNEPPRTMGFAYTPRRAGVSEFSDKFAAVV